MIQRAVSGTSYFNPRPPRGGRRIAAAGRSMVCPISIHAPREGGDVSLGAKKYVTVYISIHAPREGGDEVSIRMLDDDD